MRLTIFLSSHQYFIFWIKQDSKTKLLRRPPSERKTKTPPANTDEQDEELWDTDLEIDCKYLSPVLYDIYKCYWTNYCLNGGLNLCHTMLQKLDAGFQNILPHA